MNVVILAGGLGTRLSEETEIKPKPMVEVGEHPIVWHIMKSYARYGYKEFFLALGYKGEIVKRYFLDHYSLGGSLRVNLSSGLVEDLEKDTEDWTCAFDGHRPEHADRGPCQAAAKVAGRRHVHGDLRRRRL